MQITGHDGHTLEQAWAQGPTAYQAVSIPNFFMLNGPTGPVGNFSLIDIAELQWGYIAQLIELVRSGQCQEVSAAQSALDAYDVARKEAARKTVFGSGCNSWYLDAEGVPNTWPWSQQRFKDEMAGPKLEAFVLR